MGRASDNIPIISIILPVYNGEKYIKNTIDQLLNIKSNKEIIVVNDCSNDNSLKLLKEYKNKINLINLKENHGASYARNIGLDNAKGKYIAFVDIDDFFDNNIYDKMLKNIERENADICVCNYDEFFEGKNIKSNSKYNYQFKNLNKRDSLRLFLADKISPAIWDKIYKRELFENIRFDESLLIGEDIHFCLNLFYNCKKVTFINENLYHYLQQETSLMHTISYKLLHFKKVIEKISEEEKKYLEKEYNEEFNYFKLEMVTRGIHSLSTLSNKKNKKQVESYLKEYCNNSDFDKILKSKYYSKSIKIEIFILKIFGIKAHLFLMPFYKKIRNILRK